MSLDFSFKDCKEIDHDKLWVEYPAHYNPDKTESDLNVVAKSLVFISMFVGINKITEDNYLEFWRRVDVYQKVYGTMFQISDGDGWNPYFLTEDDVKNHIGMSTNASPITKQKFQMSLGSDQKGY